MASSEIVDSGRLDGQKSHFSQTCSLLNQYLKEKKGSLGDLNLGINRNFDSADSTTMDLLPMIEKLAVTTNPQKSMKLAESSTHDNKAQMTIFYAGQVFMFNDFPADKAKEIMLMASSNKQKQAESAVNLVNHAVNMTPSQPIVSDLPIARRASLTRFLEKRKDRLTAKVPYQISKHTTPPKQEENKAWLGLGAQFPVITEL
ncbi:unnamed protein product [Withania somnifera]